MRYLFFLFSLTFTLPASGQIYIDSYRFGVSIPPTADSILDTYTGAAGAYSLRLLDKDYSGNCVLVRRNNGDTSNIGFVSGYLDTAALKTFCGTGGTDTCRVRRWYDQSGNGRHLDSSAGIQLPRFYNNGALQYVNGKVAINFLNGVNTELRTATVTLLPFNDTDYSLYGVLQHATSNTVPYSIVRSNSNARYLSGPNRPSGNANRAEADFRWSITGVDCLADTMNLNTQYLSDVYLENVSSGNANIKHNFNGRTLSSTAVTYATAAGDTPNQFIAGQQRGTTPTAYFTGFLQELIIYDSNKQSDRTGILNNINSFYSIY